jgi:hypothetical protein
LFLHFSRHDGSLAQAAQDHFFRALDAPRLDSALQRPQLCLAGNTRVGKPDILFDAIQTG